MALKTDFALSTVKLLSHVFLWLPMMFLYLYYLFSLNFKFMEKLYS